MQVLSLLSLISINLASAFNEAANDNIALYWGQNSAGGENTQQRLSHYCESTGSDLVMISFLNQFKSAGGLPSINVANACGGSYFNGTNLLKCDNIAEDIAKCQAMGKKVLLSLGGAFGEYGLSSAKEAEDFADQVWNLFGNGQSLTRPFSKSVVDGFDLDIEKGDGTYYPNFVNRMRVNYKKDPSRKYYISAAPQCPRPDKTLEAAMTQSELDFIFVQFYNNNCGLKEEAESIAGGESSFNFEAWHKFATTESKNKNVKVYLGVAGSPKAAGSGYVPAKQVIKVANGLKHFSSFGGVMIWDASQAFGNDDFAAVVKKGIENPKPSPTPSSSAAPTSEHHVSTTSVPDVSISTHRRDAVITVTSTVCDSSCHVITTVVPTTTKPLTYTITTCITEPTKFTHSGGVITVTEPTTLTITYCPTESKATSHAASSSAPAPAPSSKPAPSPVPVPSSKPAPSPVPVPTSKPAPAPVPASSTAVPVVPSPTVGPTVVPVPAAASSMSISALLVFAVGFLYMS